jgi:hypothetical protein
LQFETSLGTLQLFEAELQPVGTPINQSKVRVVPETVGFIPLFACSQTKNSPRGVVSTSES